MELSKSGQSKTTKCICSDGDTTVYCRSAKKLPCNKYEVSKENIIDVLENPTLPGYGSFSTARAFTNGNRTIPIGSRHPEMAVWIARRSGLRFY